MDDDEYFGSAVVSVRIQIRIRIQLFTSMRIPTRIQVAKPMRIQIQILAVTKNLILT